MLRIKSPYSYEFNLYIIEKMKADLRKSASFFLQRIEFSGKEYTLDQCIESLTQEKGVILFKLEILVKHLVYNRRELFWLRVVENYSSSLSIEYLHYRSRGRI